VLLVEGVGAYPHCYAAVSSSQYNLRAVALATETAVPCRAPMLML